MSRYDDLEKLKAALKAGKQPEPKQEAPKEEAGEEAAAEDKPKRKKKVVEQE
jgi:hypothetical protein